MTKPLRMTHLHRPCSIASSRCFLHSHSLVCFHRVPPLLVVIHATGYIQVRIRFNPRTRCEEYRRTLQGPCRLPRRCYHSTRDAGVGYLCLTALHWFPFSLLCALPPRLPDTFSSPSFDNLFSTVLYNALPLCFSMPCRIPKECVECWYQRGWQDDERDQNPTVVSGKS